MKRRISAILLAVMLVVSLCGTSLAAGTTPQISLTAQQVRSQTAVTVYVTAEGATSGRIIMKYDPEQVKLVYAAAENDTWVVSIDTGTPGEVAFAWVGSDLSVRNTQVLTVLFQNTGDTDELVTYEADLTELYDSGRDLLAGLPKQPHTEIEVQTEYNTPVKPEEPDIPTPEEPAKPVENDDNPFTDIDGHWAKDYILKAYHDGLVKGITNTTFGPEVPVTRGMFVTLLYRLSGEPAVSGSSPFTDVPANQYYAAAVQWAYTNQVVKGTSDTAFSPDAPIARQELVTMLYRYAGYAGMDDSASKSLASFSDAGSVASWATQAMEWAVAEGIIEGAGNALQPQANTTRAQAATILVRFAD